MKHWSQRETQYLKDRYNTVPIEVLAKELGRTPSAIYNRVRYLRKRGWTFERKNANS